MKLHFRMPAAALALAVFSLAIIGLVVFSSGEAWAATSHASADGGTFFEAIRGHLVHASPALIALRSDLDGLVKRAADKIAELKDDTPAEQGRAIEADHNKLLAEIEAKRSEITKLEAEEASATPPSEAARAADILDVGRRANMDLSVIEEALRAGTSLDDFRRSAFDHMVQQQSGSRTSPARVIQDERDTARAAATEAMSYRLGVPVPQAGPSAAARERMNDGMISLAMRCTEARQYPRNPREIEELFERAVHTTSDFPIIMENSMNRTVEARYRLAEPTYRRISRQRNFRDFRPHTVIKTGDFPMLERVKEGGEIKYGTLTEGKESLSVLSYARAIAVSRQLMINDDLGAINDMLSDYGSTVALFEEITFYALAFNGNLADGKAVFHADHNNLAAAAAAIDVDSVSLGRASMRKQKSLDGNPLLANGPSLLLTGPDTITAAEKLVASITPATLSNVNIFSGRLSPFDTAQITTAAWYLFASPETGSNYRWGYLEGYDAPRVRVDTPFGRQGMAMSVEHDFGCGATDYRYGYKNAGA
jgi:hypothetical protein